MSRTRRTAVISAATAALVALSSVGAAAQDEPQAANVADVNAGKVTGSVTIDGAALVQKDDEEYYFSDGTDITVIDIDTSGADADVPLMTLINIVGATAGDEIDVTSWAPLEIMTPAVIKTPEDVTKSFMGWIVAYNSMAPMEEMSEDGE